MVKIPSMTAESSVILHIQPYITAQQVNADSPPCKPGQLSLLRGEFWVYPAAWGGQTLTSVGRTGSLWEACPAKFWPVAAGCQGQVSAGCRAHMQWEVLSTAAFPLRGSAPGGWVWFQVSFLSQGWRQTPLEVTKALFHHQQGQGKLSCRPSWLFPGLTGQGQSFPDPETFWASPGHPCQVSQMQTWLVSHSSPKVWLCFQQLHRSIPVSRCLTAFTQHFSIQISS